MDWALPAAALAAVAVALGTPALLRALPPPHADPAEQTGPVGEAGPYRPLATGRFALAVGVGVAGAGALAVTLAPTVSPAFAGLATLGVLSAAIDARTGYLPRMLARAAWALTAAGLLACLPLAGPGPLLPAVAGAAATTALFWAFWRWGGGFGFGDVRLAPVIGAASAAVSWTTLAVALFLGGLLGVAWGLAWRATGRGRSFPYGPALVAGPFLALIARAMY
ncbi:prepilin peptidase [Micropruina sonneratiae]|uniref:prepilin peptidase n=1 Tax=Micropruina sonneratiae TaxID=2986940 RepID=UPI00222689E8|nr:prepilin peptidase [Micropruina sp. KQZ13P-5]MCW3156845.1 prepilin peptidase [Micropruina sp. KQZ13P-5]